MAYGYTELDYKFSEMVRYNLLSREEALEKLITQTNTIISNIPYLRDELTTWYMPTEIIEKFDIMCANFKHTLHCA